MTRNLSFAHAITHSPSLQAQRDPDEEGDYMAFEQLMAEAAAKKGKDDKDKEKKDGKKSKKDEPPGSHQHSVFHSHDKASEASTA